MIEKKEANLIKTIILFMIYLIYISFFIRFFNAMGIKNELVVGFIADIIFMFGIVALYRDTLRDDFLKLFKEKTLFEILLIVVKWVIVLIFAQLFLVFIFELLFPFAKNLDNNTKALLDLSKMSFAYTIFKSLVFSVVAEELLFRKTLRDVINNKFLFILISAFLYAFMNIAYADWSNYNFLLDFFIYFYLYSFLSYMYIKYDNIIIVMLVKITHVFIPLIMLLLIGGKW